MNSYDDYINAALVRRTIEHSQSLSQMVDRLKSLPTVKITNSEIVAEWLPYEFGDETWHKCSNCGTADKYGYKYTSYIGTEQINYSIRNYCPCCGARMVVK